MTTINGPHVTNLAQHLSMRQEFPEEHIQCVLPGSIEQVYDPGDVIVRSGEVVDILEAESNVITVIMKRWWRKGVLVALVLCFGLRQSSWKLGLAPRVSMGCIGFKLFRQSIDVPAQPGTWRFNMRNMIRNSWRNRWVTVATVLAVLLAACSSAADPGVSSGGNPASSGSSPAGDNLAQDLSFTLYQGSDVLGEGNLTISSLQGKPLVINFWAGLCPPCRAEMPDLQEFYDENKDRVNLLGIDVGQFTGLGDQASAKALLEELNVTYPVGFTNDGGVMRDYKILGMPTTIFIDSKGETFRHWGGVLNKDTLTRVTNEMIELDSATSKQ